MSEPDEPDEDEMSDRAQAADEDRRKDEERVQHWTHSRKGPLRGIDTSPDDPEWARIQMVGDQKIRIQSRDGDPHYADGEILMCRRSFLTPADKEPHDG